MFRGIRIKEKHKSLILALAVLFVAFAAGRKAWGWMAVKDMTLEEKEIYYEQKAEEKKGYRLLSSHQLAEEERALKELLVAFKAGDTLSACRIMGVPDTFDGTTYKRWLADSGLAWMLECEESDIGVISGVETKTEKVDYQEVSYEETAYYLFLEADSSVRSRFLCEEGEGGVLLIPEKGVARDYTLLAPVKALYEHSLTPETGNDLSGYVTTTVTQPFAAQEDWATFWYQYDFPRFLDCEPHFLIVSDIGTFDSEYVEAPASDYGAEETRFVLAKFPDEAVEEILQGANDSLKKTFSLLQGRASEAEIGKYLLSASVLATCSEGSQEYEQIYGRLETVTGCSLYLNEEACGTLPMTYNCRIAESDGVIIRVNVLVSTTEGECRKATTLHLRYLDGIWKIADMDISNNNNIFVDISGFDPQW